LDDFPELVAADSCDCADPSVAESLCNLEKTGKQQYEAFVEDVLVKRTKSISDTIKKNKLSLFKQPRNSNPSKQGKQIAALKNDVSIFSQLYIALQTRQGDIRDFFSHEVHKYPPSISEYGRLRLPSSKSDLLKCLPQSGEATIPNHFDCKILDGAVIVHSLPTTNASTFDNYAVGVFIPYILQQLNDCKRVDIVWDDYRPESLKESTCEKRGKGIRRRQNSRQNGPSFFGIP
jgi:hypothetical protein